MPDVWDEMDGVTGRVEREARREQEAAEAEAQQLQPPRARSPMWLGRRCSRVAEFSFGGSAVRWLVFQSQLSGISS